MNKDSPKYCIFKYQKIKQPDKEHKTRMVPHRNIEFYDPKIISQEGIDTDNKSEIIIH